MTIANIVRNSPFFRNAINLLAVTIPISNKNIDKNPLKMIFVNGLIPSACFVSAIKPITKLPIIMSALPLVNE